MSRFNPPSNGMPVIPGMGSSATCEQGRSELQVHITYRQLQNHPQAQWSQLQHSIYGKRSRPYDTELQQTSVLSLIQTQGCLSSAATLKLFAGKCSHTDYAATYRLHGLESPQPEERNVSEHTACVGSHSPGATSPSRDASSAALLSSLAGEHVPARQGASGWGEEARRAAALLMLT